MSLEAPNWYINAYVDGVVEAYQAKGFMLKGMSTDPARITGNTVNWMTGGAGDAVPLQRGSIGASINSQHGTIQATMQDWQAATWVYDVDITKMTANEMDYSRKMCWKAIGRRSDLILLGAIQANASITTISDGAVSTITGTGFTLPMALGGIQIMQSRDIDFDDGNMFCGLPSLAWNQFMSYRQVNDADWVGYDGQPYKTGVQFKNWNGVRWFRLSDKYAVNTSPYQQDFWMWHKSAVGFATNYDVKTMVTWENLYSGWYHNNRFGASAAALLPLGMIRFRINPATAITVN